MDVTYVCTLNSVYVLNREAMTARRMPPAEGGELRRDFEAVPLLEWTDPKVGEPLVMWLQIRDDGVPTRRTTSEVWSVEP